MEERICTYIRQADGEHMNEEKTSKSGAEAQGFPDPRARIKQKRDEEMPRAGAPAAENEDEGDEVLADGEPAVESGKPNVVAVNEEKAADRLVRMMADFDNFRRRTAKDNALERQRGRREAVEKLLPVYDSLSMGMLTMPAGNPVRAGMEAVQLQLQNAFAGLGLKKVPTAGQVFDPQVHEAIAHMMSADVAEGTVMQESRAGFFDEVGLLRPAQVVVSSGSG
ncbi:nucleotide exchange factor GrpE [soil metagenome]